MSDVKLNLTEEYTSEQVIFKRDESGIVKSGDLTCQIPTDRLALGLLSLNKAFDGDVFAEDYWVYNNGRKIRKWFVSTEAIKRLWPPNLDNTKRLDSLYQRFMERIDGLWSQTISPTLKEIANNGGYAHARPTHKYTGEQDRWWVYNVSPYNNSLSFSFDWIDGSPKKKINAELGQTLYVAERYWGSLCKRASIVRSALDESIKKKIQTRIASHEINDPKDRYFHVEVNERSYWYTFTRTHFGGHELKCIAWPESKTEYILIGETSHERSK